MPTLDHVYQNHHLDSTRWEIFTPRDDDIIITSSYKSGTTWTQWIVYSLIFCDDRGPPPFGMASPWIDARFVPVPLEGLAEHIKSQTHRRFLKSHLPADGLPYFSNVKYIVLARDARDVFMSLCNHFENYTDSLYKQLNEKPGRVGPVFPRWSGNLRAVWRDWITRGWFEWESEGYPFWSNMHHTATWWPFRNLANVLLVHYNDMKRDLPGQIARIARYLDIDVGDDQLAEISARAHIDAMREDARNDPARQMTEGFRGGVDAFYFKGTNERWRGVLDASDLELYEAAKERVLETDCAVWLERGGSR